LQQIAETTARLFGAPSVSIQLAANGEWTQTYRFGNSAQRVRSAVPIDMIRIGGPNLPGTVVVENRQIACKALPRRALGKSRERCLNAGICRYPGAEGSAHLIGTRAATEWRWRGGDRALFERYASRARVARS
jgi:hypothetical protein